MSGELPTLLSQSRTAQLPVVGPLLDIRDQWCHRVAVAPGIVERSHVCKILALVEATSQVCFHVLLAGPLPPVPTTCLCPGSEAVPDAGRLLVNRLTS